MLIFWNLKEKKGYNNRGSDSNQATLTPPQATFGAADFCAGADVCGSVAVDFAAGLGAIGRGAFRMVSYTL